MRAPIGAACRVLAEEKLLEPDPRKVTFHTQTLVGFKDGGALSTDEYGRHFAKDDDPEEKKLRDKEWQTFQRAKQSWDSSFGELSSQELRRAFFGYE